MTLTLALTLALTLTLLDPDPAATVFVIAKIDGNPVVVALKNDKLKDGTKVYKVAEVASVYDLENSLTKIAQRTAQREWEVHPQK